MAHRYLILIIAAPLLAQEFHQPVVIPNSARTDRGTLEFRTANDQRGVKLRSASSMAGDYTMDLPDALGSSGDCLKLIATSVLGFGACGSGGGWTLSSDELSPVDTSATLRLIRATNGQGIGSWAKPWSGVFATTFQAPNAAGTDAKMTLNSSSLTGADTAGNTTISMLFNSGFVSISGTFRANGIVGQDTDVLHVLKNAALSSSNWRWAISHRADGRQLWFYGYDGSNFTIPLKLNPNGNSVCVNCPGDVTPGYSLDVGGQALVTGLKAAGAGGYVNAAQIEHRDNSTGLHFGWNANIALIAGIPGSARYVTLQDASSNPIIRMYSHITGPAEPRVQVYGDLTPDADATRKLGVTGRRWSEAHAQYLYVDNVEPRPGSAGQINWGADLFPSIATMKIGHSANRVSQVWVTDLNVSGTCTGCGGGSSKWTTSGTTMFPTTATSFLEIIPSAGVQQSLGSLTNRWLSVHALAHYVPNTSGSALRASLSASGLILYDLIGNEKLYIGSANGDMEVHGTMRFMNLGGGGNAQVCIDATGQIYRGTPGC